MAAADRRQQIVAEATAIFAQMGYSAFSLRAVSKTCGISLAAVQYHFADRETLIMAIAQEAVDSSSRAIEAILRSSPPDPRIRLEATLEHLIALNNDKQTARLFMELWAFASKYSQGRAVVENLYAPVRTLVVELIEALCPGLGREDAMRRTLILLAAADGLLITTLHSSPQQEECFPTGQGALARHLIALHCSATPDCTLWGDLPAPRSG